MAEGLRVLWLSSKEENMLLNSEYSLPYRYVVIVYFFAASCSLVLDLMRPC